MINRGIPWSPIEPLLYILSQAQEYANELNFEFKERTGQKGTGTVNAVQQWFSSNRPFDPAKNSYSAEEKEKLKVWMTQNEIYFPKRLNATEKECPKLTISRINSQHWQAFIFY